jgi:uroporphyrinogen-III synthase
MARLLLTRPAEDSERMAEILRQAGHACASLPVFTIRNLPGNLPDLAGITGLLFTSRNGVRAFAAATPRRDFAVFAVGEASAAAARDAGFTRVTAGGGDVDSLAATVATAAVPADCRLLHVAGETLTGDLCGLLQARGFTVSRCTLYAAEAIADMPADMAAALAAGSFDAVMFFSPRTAAVFAELARKCGLSSHFRIMRAFCLSERVAAAAAALPWQHVITSPVPTEAALLAALHGDLS